MSEASGKVTDHPFLCLDHGPWDPSDEKKEVDGYIWFERSVPEGDRKAIEEGVPEPLRSFFNWSSGGDVLHFGQDENLDLAIKEAYGNVPASEDDVPSDEELIVTEDELRRFLGDVDAWILQAHGRTPVFLGIGVGGDPEDAWNTESIHAIPKTVLPRLRAAFSAARPPSEETRARDAQERMLAWVLFRVLAAYLDNVDASEVGDDTKALIGELVARSKGYSTQADNLNQSYLRSVQR